MDDVTGLSDRLPISRANRAIRAHLGVPRWRSRRGRPEPSALRAVRFQRSTHSQLRRDLVVIFYGICEQLGLPKETYLVWLEE